MKIYYRKTDNYSSHSIVTRIIKNQHKFKTKILDLGCDVGFLGRNLSVLNHKYEIHGVDKDPKNLEKAKFFYHHLYNFDLNNKTWPIRNKFEIIVIADTLEHLYNPGLVIKKILNFLTKDGILIISIPNSVFLWARLNILFGKFPKDNRGLFDKTHLHFFTYETMINLMNSYCLKIEQFYSTAVPIQLILKKHSNNLVVKIFYNLSYRLANIYPNLFAYQLIFVTSRG